METKTLNIDSDMIRRGIESALGNYWVALMIELKDEEKCRDIMRGFIEQLKTKYAPDVQKI